MKNRLFAFTLMLMCLLPTWAENYPYRSDLLWVTVPDHADWLYKTGEKATVEVQLYRYGIPQDGVILSYTLGQDNLKTDMSGTVTLKNGRAKVDMGTMKKPGFRDCNFTVEFDGKKYNHHVKVGFSPEKLQPVTKLPKDFNDFWNAELEELKKVPLKYTTKHVPEYSNEKIDCYLIKLDVTNRGQCVYGYLTRPKAKGAYPVVLNPPGAGIKTIKEPMRRKYYAEEGCIRLEMEIHGLNPEIDASTFKEISNAFNSRENGYLSNGLEMRDTYYMKRVYLACVRAIDYLTSLPEWDGKNVAVQGGSQGGALALITAGLDKRVTACVANHPALSDMAGYEAGETGGYPHFNNGRNIDLSKQQIETLQYFDVVNFARQITCPVRITWGYNDNVCPPTTSWKVYNVMTCPKEPLITPINEHWTTEETEYGHLKWILNHLK